MQGVLLKRDMCICSSSVEIAFTFDLPLYFYNNDEKGTEDKKKKKLTTVKSI